MLDWLLKEKQITQHVSVLDRSNREGGTCERADCPGQHAGTTDVCDRHFATLQVRAFDVRSQVIPDFDDGDD